MRALVVEDEPLIRMHLCDLLEEAGFECGEAGNAAQAIALLEDGWRPEILVTDFNLGPGPDGAELAADVLRRLPKLRIVFATGNPECLAGRGCRPADRILAKPFSAAELIEAVGDPDPCETALHAALARPSPLRIERAI
jgi:CheY-like chemotaxis protein